MDRQLGLELSDTPFRCREFGLLSGRDAGLEAGVNSRLAAPGVDRLLADLELCSDLGYLPTSLNQIYDSSPELRRVAPPCHIAPLRDYGSGVQFSPSVKVGARHDERSPEAASEKPNTD